MRQCLTSDTSVVSDVHPPCPRLAPPQPFVAAFPHDDGITTLARNPKSLNSIVSGAADGDIRILDIAHKRTLRRLVRACRLVCLVK